MTIGTELTDPDGCYQFAKAAVEDKLLDFLLGHEQNRAFEYSLDDSVSWAQWQDKTAEREQQARLTRTKDALELVGDTL